jgi:hypothetical protein
VSTPLAPFHTPAYWVTELTLMLCSTLTGYGSRRLVGRRHSYGRDHGRWCGEAICTWQ